MDYSNLFFKLPDKEIFKRAVSFVLPELEHSDPRYNKVVDYLIKDYKKNNNGIAIIIRNDEAESNFIVTCSTFLRRLKLDTGMREVIINNGYIIFIENYEKYVRRSPKLPLDSALQSIY